MIRARLLAAGLFALAAGVNVALLSAGMDLSALIVSTLLASTLVVGFLLAPWIRRRALDPDVGSHDLLGVLHGVGVLVLAFLLGLVAFAMGYGLVAPAYPMSTILWGGLVMGLPIYFPGGVLAGGAAGWVFQWLVRRGAV